MGNAGALLRNSSEFRGQCFLLPGAAFTDTSSFRVAYQNDAQNKCLWQNAVFAAENVILAR